MQFETMLLIIVVLITGALSYAMYDSFCCAPREKRTLYLAAYLVLIVAFAMFTAGTYIQLTQNNKLEYRHEKD